MLCTRCHGFELGHRPAVPENPEFVTTFVSDANRIGLPPLVMGEAMARAERYVGTLGGGMDQAISLGARKGTVGKVAFSPLSITHVPLPATWRFVVASSLVPAEKSGTAQAAYNERTREVESALHHVWSRLGADAPEEQPTYRALLARQDQDIGSVAADSLPPLLAARFRHVISEAERVDRAVDALRSQDLESFGRLMDQSHASLRDDYDVSGPDLDRLVELARDAGAAGARLTGAGFGGCVVALVREEAVPDLVGALSSAFYEPRGMEPGPGEHLFEARPGAGASVKSIA